MIQIITFSAPTGSIAKAIPADPSIPLSHYTDYGIAATESISQPGTFTITLDDTEYLKWWIFLGTSNPTTSDNNHAIIDLSQGPLVEQYDTATLIDSFNRFAVTGSGVTPNIYAADIGLAVSGTGNSRQWQWTVSGVVCTLARDDSTGTDRWVIIHTAGGMTLFLGPTSASPVGVYTKEGSADTVTLARKQIARKAWRFKASALNVVSEPGDPIPPIIPPSPDIQTCNCFVRVLDDETMEPVVGESVYFYMKKGPGENGVSFIPKEITKITDNDGEILILLPRNSEYYIWIDKSNVLSFTVPDEVSATIPEMISTRNRPDEN